MQAFFQKIRKYAYYAIYLYKKVNFYNNGARKPISRRYSYYRSHFSRNGVQEVSLDATEKQAIKLKPAEHEAFSCFGDRSSLFAIWRPVRLK